MNFDSLWTQNLTSPPLGLALAREKNMLLAWEESNWLSLFDARGFSQGRFHFSGSLKSACAADDGSAFVAAGKGGEVVWLQPDLMVRWEKKLSAPLLTAALDSFGQYVALADNQCRLHLLNCFGQEVAQGVFPRPMHHLAFVPAAPLLVGCADFGLVAGFDLTGRILWRDILVVNLGGLSVNSDGSSLLLACFSEGLRRFDLHGKMQKILPTPDPCRLVSQTIDGSNILVGGLANQLFLMNQEGQVLARHALEKALASLVLDPLGKIAYVAQVDGKIGALRLTYSGNGR